MVKSKRVRLSSPEKQTNEDNHQVIEAKATTIEDSIDLSIPRTAATHSRCIICSNTGKMICVPEDAYLDTLIKSNIIIPKGIYPYTYDILMIYL